MRRRLSSRKARFAAVLAVALLAAGGAIAYYNAPGRGSVHGTIGSPVELTIAAVTPAEGLLYPGGSGDVKLTITNPNPFPVRVNSLVGTGIDADGAHADCNTDALHFATQNNGNDGWTVDATGSLGVQLADAITMDSGAANECQGAAFTVHLDTGP